MSGRSDSSVHENEPDLLADYEDLESNAGSNDEHEGEAVEDVENEGETEEGRTKVRVDPKVKRVVRNPMITLNTERLKGPKGICAVEKYFEGFKFGGKGHEKTDLDRIMKRLEHWSHRLFPKLDFDDFLNRTEKLGTKKDLKVFLTKYRQDMITTDDDIPLPDYDEENQVETAPMDAFDRLISEQIEKQKQATRSLENSVLDTSFDDSNTNRRNIDVSTQGTKMDVVTERRDKPAGGSTGLTDEIRARIERNRQQAIEKRLARLHARKEECGRSELETEKIENRSKEVVEDKEISVDDKDDGRPIEIFHMELDNVTTTEG